MSSTKSSPACSRSTSRNPPPSIISSQRLPPRNGSWVRGSLRGQLLQRKSRSLSLLRPLQPYDPRNGPLATHLPQVLQRVGAHQNCPRGRPRQTARTTQRTIYGKISQRKAEGKIQG